VIDIEEEIGSLKLAATNSAIRTPFIQN